MQRRKGHPLRSVCWTPMAAQRGGLGGSPTQRRRCRCSSTATSSAAKRNSGHSWCLDGPSSGRPAQLSAWSTRYRRCVPTQACSTGADTAMRPRPRRGRDALLAEGCTASINGLYGPCTGTRRRPPWAVHGPVPSIATKGAAHNLGAKALSLH